MKMFETIKKLFKKEEVVVRSAKVGIVNNVDFVGLIDDKDFFKACHKYKKLWDLYDEYRDGKNSMLKLIDDVKTAGFTVKVVQHLGRPMMPYEDELLIDLDFYSVNIRRTRIDEKRESDVISKMLKKQEEINEYKRRSFEIEKEKLEVSISLEKEKLEYMRLRNELLKKKLTEHVE
jgi:hypothetical protein